MYFRAYLPSHRCTFNNLAVCRLNVYVVRERNSCRHGCQARCHVLMPCCQGCQGNDMSNLTVLSLSPTRKDVILDFRRIPVVCKRVRLTFGRLN